MRQRRLRICTTRHKSIKRLNRRGSGLSRDTNNEESLLNEEITKRDKKSGGEGAAPNYLVIKKVKVWWYTFSKGSAPLSFSDRLNKGRYLSCHGLSRLIGAKMFTNQSCLCVHVPINNIKCKTSPPDQPSHKQFGSPLK